MKKAMTEPIAISGHRPAPQAIPMTVAMASRTSTPVPKPSMGMAAFNSTLV